MASEALRASVASNRDVSDQPPGPFQDCSDVVHIAVFFDGTGNNKDADEGSKKWSNVARMWQSAVQRSTQVDRGARNAMYAIYVSGVGTQFNGTATSWMDKSDVWVEDTLTGMGGGGGGDRRLEMGSANVNDRLRQVLLANARRMGGSLAAYASSSQAKGFAEVNGALGKHRLIKVINVSVFGFSRGAALARAFLNRIVGQCKRSSNDLLYHGYPLRLTFSGLFDTVASFGLPASNVRLPWDERELLMPAEVERCVHFVAAHELRFAFPVDLIRTKGQLLGSSLEKCYPGVHSDVGGGYEPVDQGVSNNYARIPMRDMMSEAVMSGVRMFSYAQIESRFNALFSERFECKPKTLEAYSAYTRHVSGSGRIEDARKSHMQLLYSAYGTLHRLGVETAGERARQESFARYKYIGPKGMAWEVAKYRAAKRAGDSIDSRFRIGTSVEAYAQYVKPQDWQLSAWDANAPAGVAEFVRDYVHDSKVNFVGNIEPFSYFRLRTIQESTRSVWNETGDWVSEKGRQAAETTGAGVDYAKQRAEQAAEAAKAHAIQARNAAAAAYERAKAATTDAYDAGREKARQAYVAAQKVVDQAERDAADLAREGGRVIEDGVEWIERQSGEASTALEEAGRRVKSKLGF